MARKPFERNSELPYHITARCINRDWFGRDLSKVWPIFEEQLYLANKAYGLAIHSFVLMPNHFHLIARSPNNNLSSAMRCFMKNTSFLITKSAGRINRTYSDRFHRSLMKSPLYYLHAYKYVYRNPVKARLSDKVEDYPYSTLHGLLGKSKLIVPVEIDDQLFNDVDANLAWLNTKPAKQNDERVRRALKRQIFKMNSRLEGSHKNPLEDTPL